MPVQTIVIVSAHPDDMEIGIGGTVAKLAANGARITSVVLTDGRRSPNPFGWTEDQMAKTRREEVRRAALLLNIDEPICFGLPDLKASQNYTYAKGKLTALMKQSRPDEIYTLHPTLDRHSTHRLAAKITLDSAKATTAAKPSMIWAYEVWGLFPTWDRLVFIDNQIATKLKAIAQHKSQVAQIPYGEAVMGLNRWRAVFATPDETEPGGTYAEALISLSA